MTPKSKPLVSVVVPAYNAEDALVQCLLSVQHQTMSDWELLVVDDGSADRTPLIAKYFSEKDSRVRYIAPQGARGAGNARQRGVGLSSAEFVAFLDADDIWLPEKLQQTLEFTRTTGSSWTYTAYRAILKSGKIGLTVRPKRANHRNSFLGENPIAVSSSVVRKSIIPTQIDFYTPIGQDRQLWLPLAKSGHQPSFLDSATTLYRLSQKSLSSNKWIAATVRFKNLQFENPNPIRRTWNFMSYVIIAGAKNLMRQIPCNGCSREIEFLEMLEQEATSVKARIFL